MIEEWKLEQHIRNFIFIEHIACPSPKSGNNFMGTEMRCIACGAQPPQEIIDAALLVKAWPFDR